MKPKQIITYIKDGKEYKRVLNPLPFYNTAVLLTLFEHVFIQDNHFDYYRIKDNITYLHLKDVRFYHDLKFDCPKDTILILEHCQFNGPNLHIIGGHVQVIDPQLPTHYYSNNIYISDCEDFSLTSQMNNNFPLKISAYANKIEIDGPQKIKSIYLVGKHVTIKNISKLKSLSTKAEITKIINSNIEIDDVIEYQEQEILNQICQSDDFEENKNFSDSLKIQSESVELQNSSITTFGPLNIRCQKIVADQTSKLRSNHDIIIGTDVYKNSTGPNTLLIISPALLNNLSETSQERISRRKLISILKGIKKQAEKEINKTVNVKINEISKKNTVPMPTNALIRQKTKKYKNGMIKERKIGTFKSFQ